MSDHEPTLAGDLYEHRLEPQQGGRLRRLARAVWVVGDLVAAAVAAPIDLTSAGDVVVRRKVDAVEVLRVPAGPPEEAARMLAHVGEQLEDMSPEEFRGAWGIDGIDGLDPHAT